MPTPRETSTLTFHGGAETVTGSKFLVQTQNARILVDCGLFQGERVLRRRNWEPPFVDPTTVDAVVLTHAHLDHSGYLPVLARHGFSGPVWCTGGTAELAAIVLTDAAHLQEQETERSREHGYSKHERPEPLFNTQDAARAVALMRPVPFDEPTRVAPAITARLRPAGHILGSAYVELEVAGTRVLFSGDLGRDGHPFFLPPEPPHDVDVAVVESTYGDETHPAPEDDLLAGAISRTLRRGGTCLLPTFAVDRTPLIVHALSRLRDQGRIPSEVPVYVDSPMALRAWEVYRKALHDRDPQMRPDLDLDELDWDRHVISARDRADSEELNDPAHPCVIVSASGMATGGRVLHHLRAQLPRSRNCVILTGFQVPGTRGQALADGARELKIHGRYVPVRAEVVSLRGFSAHADGDQMLRWLGGLAEPEVVYVVHGEPAASAALATRIRDELDWTAVAPRYQERVLLG